MKEQFWIPQLASAPAPADIAAYLLQQMWKFTHGNEYWAEYVKDVRGENFVIEVPQRAAAGDYPRALEIFINDMSRIEGRSPSELLRNIKEASSDIVRLAIDGRTTRDGRISVEAGRRVYEAVRDMLLAAACSVIDPRPVFAKRKPEEAMNFLSRARFGQTSVGSFILSIECNITPRLQTTLFGQGNGPEDLFPGNESEDPFERKTSKVLSRALHAAEGASRESAASGMVDPFRSRTGDGVSANLCEAIAEIIDASEAETLQASFSFASRRPIINDVPRIVTFSADTSSILREAASFFRKEATYPATEVLGTVIELNSANAATGGEVVLSVYRDGKTRNVHVPLPPDSYETAIHAHKEVRMVRCTGDLSRDRGSFILRNPHDFEIVPEQDDA